MHLILVNLFALVAVALKGRASHNSLLTVALRRQQFRSSSDVSALQIGWDDRPGHESATVGLTERRHIYSGPLKIGSQNQEFTVIFDTGSANLMVPSASCESHGCRGGNGKRVLDSHSTTSGAFVSMAGTRADYGDARHFSLAFSSGKASGVSFEDTICLWTRSDDDAICAHNAKFLLAEWESDDFADFEFDGIFGLAPKGPLSAGPGFSLMDMLVSQGALSRRMFAFYLSESSDQVSEVSLGGYDANRVRESLTWLKVNTRGGAWAVNVNDITVNGSSQGFRPCAAFLGRCTAVLDTGCSGVGLPKGMTDKLSKQIGFTGERLQCTDPAMTLPDIGFVLEGQSFALSPKDYVEVASNNEQGCRLRFSDLTNDHSFLFGHPFLQRYYSVYDEDNLQVGLSAVHSLSDVPTPGPAEAAMRRMAGSIGVGAF